MPRLTTLFPGDSGDRVQQRLQGLAAKVSELFADKSCGSSLDDLGTPSIDALSMPGAEPEATHP